MPLGSTQPLTEMSTRSISWGKRRTVRKADNLPPFCAVVMKSGNLNFLEPSGPVQACNGTVIPLPLPSTHFGCRLLLLHLISPSDTHAHTHTHTHTVGLLRTEDRPVAGTLLVNIKLPAMRQKKAFSRTFEQL
jgi:hypothetical protein